MAELRLGSLNYVVLIGRATQEPELRYSPKGTPVLSFRIAVNERVKDKETGEWKDYTSYFNVQTFGPVADRCNERMKKGSGVIVEGRLRSREWTDPQGVKKFSVEIVARRVQVLDKVAPTEPAETTEEIEIPEENIGDLPF